MSTGKLDRLIPKAEVLKLLGVSGSTLWRMTRKGEFARPVQISARRVGYPESEVSHELQRRKADRDLSQG